MPTLVWDARTSARLLLKSAVANRTIRLWSDYPGVSRNARPIRAEMRERTDVLKQQQPNEQASVLTSPTSMPSPPTLPRDAVGRSPDPSVAAALSQYVYPTQRFA